MTTSTSNNAFHPFPRLPCELRILIWELAVSPRVIHIYANPHFKKDYPTNCRVWSLSSSELSTSAFAPIPAALHAYREARIHLTHPARANGYYEKMSVECIVTPRSEEEMDDPYTWVNFAVDMIDIGATRLTLSEHYASKIRRLRLKVTMFNQPVLEVLTPGKYDYSPNLKEVEVDCPDGIGVVLSRTMAWTSMVPILTGGVKLKDMICIDPLGERMTFEKFEDVFIGRLRAARERREPVPIILNN